MDILSLLFPREKKFYLMVEKQVLLVDEAVADFKNLIINYDVLSSGQKNKIILRICQKERSDDILYTQMVQALKSTFITPIDREDLHQLTSTFELIMDTLETISLKLKIYKIKKDNILVKQSVVLFKMFKFTRRLIFSIRNESEVEKYCLQIRKLEQKADEIYIEGLEVLFSNSNSPVTIIKLKDLYSSIEKIIDKIHEASLIIENVAVKYS
ncbi:MAG: DUF47 family protein [Bacteroidetes bacterium]|nr:MAG: DUF47 family protein [Bacteroidota bacterium]